MSPWSCRSLVATLCPDQVSLVQQRSTLTRHGFGRAVEWEHVVGVAPEADAPLWRAPLEALAPALPGHASGGVALTVVLSNRFVCYALVPPQPELADGREQLAYARHRFASLHGGAAANEWAVRLSRHSDGEPAVASAVDRQLLDGLDDLCSRAGVRLVSVQPRLMAAANGLCRRLPAGSAWLALLEPGHLCLALLRDGHWRRLRTVRHDAAWREPLCVMLDRECYQPGGALPDDVYVWHARERLDELPQAGRWRFHPLDSRSGADPLPADLE